jgi:hypothetical protein
MLSKETLLMLKKLYQKIRQIVVEWLQRTMVDQEVVAAVVCVDHHLDRVVDGDLWVANQISVEVVVTDPAAVVEATDREQIMAIDLRPMVVVVMVVKWEEVVAVV